MHSFGNVTGIATAACFVPLAVKYPARRLGLGRINSALMDMHEGASAGFLLIGTVHMAAELIGSKGAAALLKYSGLFGLVLSFWLITDCHLAKDENAKMVRHRIYSLLLALSMVCHGAAAR